MIILTSPRTRLRRSEGPESWKAFLAEPDKQWKDGRSAKLLAQRWEGAQPEVPAEVQSAFAGTPFEDFRPLLAIPEYEVALPGGRRPSQNDLFVVGRAGADLAVMMVEGKVDEPFGPTLAEWLHGASDGKRARLAHLQAVLGLEGDLPEGVRYQLLHRTASAVMEAGRLQADFAAMVVHSFSADDAGFEDYAVFAALLGATGGAGALERAPGLPRPELWLGWAKG